MSSLILNVNNSSSGGSGGGDTTNGEKNAATTKDSIVVSAAVHVSHPQEAKGVQPEMPSSFTSTEDGSTSSSTTLTAVQAN
jgi:hypothetical protein